MNKIKKIVGAVFIIVLAVMAVMHYRNNRVGTYTDKDGYIRFYNEDKINSLQTEN